MGLLDIKNYDVNPDKLPLKLRSFIIIFSFLCLAILILSLFLFPIQEKVRGEVEIYHEGIPHKIRARQGGDLNLYVKDEDEVLKGDILGMIDWDIDLSNYQKLDNLSNFYVSNNNLRELKIRLNELKHEKIPQLQGELSGVITACELYDNTYSLANNDEFERYQNKRITSLKSNKKINADLAEGRRQKTAILQDQIMNDSLLLSEGIISRRDFENRKQEYIEEILKIEERALLVESANEDIESINSSIAQSKYEIDLLNLDHYKSLLIALENYKKKFFDISEQSKVVASTNGEVELSDLLNFSKNVSIDGDILSIKPQGKVSKNIARIITDANNVGRVSEGDNVIIYLDQFPMKEFGVLSAVVKSRRDVVENERYIFDITLHEGLKMSYGESIVPQPLLTGNGYILINRTNVFDLVVNEFKARKTEYFD